MRPEMLLSSVLFSSLLFQVWTGLWSGLDVGKVEGLTISGSFCVSITAAMGMPKLDAGPQKSASRTVSQSIPHHRASR